MDFSVLPPLTAILKLPFSQGQLIFALIFLVSFIVLMIFAYRADASVNRIYYRNAWRILLSILLILTGIILLVKFLH